MKRIARDLVTQMSAHHRSLYGRESRLLHEREVEKGRRAAVVERFQATVLRAATGAAGLAEMEKRHRLDDVRAARFRDQQLRGLRAEVRHEARRFRRRVAGIRRMRDKFEHASGNPHLTVCNWFCAGIEVLRTGNGFVTNPIRSSGQRAGVNQIKTFLRADAPGRTTQTLQLLIQHHFVWDADRDGMLAATAWLNLLGTFDLTAPGACFKRPIASIEILGHLSVLQSGDALPITSPVREVLPELRIDNHCVSTVRTGTPLPLDTGDVELMRANVPIRAGRTVLASTLLVANLFAHHGGRSVLDIGSGAGRYNVPAVWFAIQS